MLKLRARLIRRAVRRAARSLSPASRALRFPVRPERCAAPDAPPAAAVVHDAQHPVVVASCSALPSRRRPVRRPGCRLVSACRSAASACRAVRVILTRKAWARWILARPFSGTFWSPTLFSSGAGCSRRNWLFVLLLQRLYRLATRRHLADDAASVYSRHDGCSTSISNAADAVCLAMQHDGAPVVIPMKTIQLETGLSAA